MKYRPVSKLCGCGKARRPGQRDCKACHAAAGKRLRDAAGAQTPAQALERTMVRVARKSGGRKLPPEFEARLRGLAERVAGDIEAFNRMGAN